MTTPRTEPSNPLRRSRHGHVMPYYVDDRVTLYHGDCRDVVASMPDGSVDAVVTDPPYELGFMGKGWDASGVAFSVELWTECRRVLKPGGHLLAFGGTRTWHRLACAIEDAGFEIRDSIAWLYATGFPKSLDVSKAIDKAAGAERTEGGREWSGGKRSGGVMGDGGGTSTRTIFDTPATPEAKRWQGWGTALKPAFEPIVVARKPLTGTVALNVLQYGTGALNIDGCRVEGEPWKAHRATGLGKKFFTEGETPVIDKAPHPAGRWPTNVVLDDTQAAELDRQGGESAPRPARTGRKGGCNDNGTLTGYGTGDDVGTWPADAGGGASRFFPTFRYEAKAPADERPKVDGIAHPTVKPLDLMRWLVRLVTPPGGTVLEPFAGSGTTAEACVIEGVRCIAIEREEAYLPLIVARLSRPIQPSLLTEPVDPGMVAS